MPTGLHSADSTILSAILSGLPERSLGTSLARSSAMRELNPAYILNIPGELLFGFGRQLFDVLGPRRLFSIVAGSLVDQWTPVGVAFGTAASSDVASLRLLAFERLGRRSIYSAISIEGDRCVTVHKLPAMPEIAKTEAQSVMYWAYVMSAYRAAGCKNIRLEHGDGLVAVDGAFDPLHSDTLFSASSMRLTWEDERPRAAFGEAGVRIMVPRHQRLVDRATEQLLAQIEACKRQPASMTARSVGMSSRSLQRRLAEVDLSLGALRRSIQLSLATRAMGAGTMSLSEVAEAAGFTDAPHFVNVFREATRMTPKTFADRLLC